jgi:hypothetical protein
VGCAVAKEEAEGGGSTPEEGRLGAGSRQCATSEREGAGEVPSHRRSTGRPLGGLPGTAKGAGTRATAWPRRAMLTGEGAEGEGGVVRTASRSRSLSGKGECKGRNAERSSSSQSIALLGGWCSAASSRGPWRQTGQLTCRSANQRVKHRVWKAWAQVVAVTLPGVKSPRQMGQGRGLTARVPAAVSSATEGSGGETASAVGKEHRQESPQPHRRGPT